MWPAAIYIPISHPVRVSFDHAHNVMRHSRFYFNTLELPLVKALFIDLTN